MQGRITSPVLLERKFMENYGKDGSDFAMISLISAVAGLLFGCHLVGGVLALYFASSAEDKGLSDYSIVKAAKIIGVIDLVIAGIVIVFFAMIFCGIDFIIWPF